MASMSTFRHFFFDAGRPAWMSSRDAIRCHEESPDDIKETTKYVCTPEDQKRFFTPIEYSSQQYGEYILITVFSKESEKLIHWA